MNGMGFENSDRATCCGGTVFEVFQFQSRMKTKVCFVVLLQCLEQLFERKLYIEKQLIEEFLLKTSGVGYLVRYLFPIQKFRRIVV